VRVIPETYIVEGADVQNRDGRQHHLHKMPMQSGLPGPSAHIEFPGKSRNRRD